MKSKTKHRARKRTHLPSITIDDIIAACRSSGLYEQPSAPPVSPPPEPAAPASGGPILWHFQHTHPQLPNSILTLCTVAPTVQEARGKAYLLAENFCQNVIGFIRANQPPQLPPAHA